MMRQRGIYIRIWLFFLALSITSINAQVISDFSARLNGSSVELRWTFNGGEQCEGTRVKHGADSLQMQTIYHVSGICGATDEEVTYEYLHEGPLENQLNYYQLVLGNRGTSEIVKVFVNSEREGLTL